MSKALKVLWFVLFAAIIIMTVITTSNYFDAQEAELAKGESFDLNSKWTISYMDGSQKEGISLPSRIKADDDKGVLFENTLSSDYKSLALSLSTKNAAIRIFIDGKPVYENGFSENRTFGKKKNNNDSSSAQDGESDAADGDVQDTEKLKDNESRTDEEAGEERKLDNLANDIDSAKNEAGDVIVDLPENIDDSAIRITMVKIDPNADMIFHGASIAQRDASIVGVIRSSLFPLVCCILLIITSVILVTLDIIRIISRKRTRGLIRLALLCIVTMFYCFIGTNILPMLLGNEEFFNFFGSMCYVLMPMLLAWFFYRGFVLHFPRRTTVLVWLTSVYAAVVLLLIIFNDLFLNDISYVTMGVQLITIASIIVMLVKWSEISDGYDTIWMDVLGYTLLTASIIMNPVETSLKYESWPGIVKNLSSTLCFIFFAAQHIHIVLSEYQADVKAQSKRLEKQMRMVEEKNTLLNIAKNEAEEARQEAIMANEAKGNFLANMSHEIRTPINAVLGMDEMILRETKEKETKGYAMDIYTAGSTLLSLINEILDFSKIESGKMEIVPVDYDISSLINDLYNMSSTRAKNKDLAFEVKVDESIPARYLGDDVRLRQILTNILTNAIKYTPEGNVWFRVSGRRDGEDCILHFEIEDTGIGIKKEDLPKLYEAYERIEEGRNRNIEGTGLGMNITIKLLSLMDSKLEVESVYGKGSRFYFDIRQPVTDETPVGDFEKRIAAQAESFSYAESFVAPDAQVLVTDDNSMNRKVFKSLLKPTLINITEASGGQEAIDLVSKNHYDIIFMDHMMPNMDGIEAMHRIRAIEDGPCRDTPIYVLTANAVAGAREQYLEEGFDGFLSKPIVSEKLEEAIRNTLPKELLQAPREDDNTAPQGRESSFDLDVLPDVDGLDWQYAWLHLCDEELLKETLEEFYTLLPVHGSRLEQLYDNISSDEGLDEYRILIHGMKSSAATVGITPLSGMAKILEFAARDRRRDIITSTHPVFMDEWYSYQEKLKGVFDIGEKDTEEKPAANMELTYARLDMLVMAMEDFDVDACDAHVNELLKYSYPKGIEERIMELKAAVTDLDGDLVNEIVESIK